MSTLPSIDPEIQKAMDSSDSFNLEFWNILKDIGGHVENQSAIPLESAFYIPSSKKLRGKGYYVDSERRFVTTKSGAFIPVEVKGVQKDDLIRTSILYDHEDHEATPVQCFNVTKPHEAVFRVMPRSNGLQVRVGDDFGRCSWTLVCSGQEKNVTYRVEFNCLNSCSKVWSDRILQLEHLRSNGVLVLKEKWKIRVCSIPKRDHNLMLDAVDPETGEKRKSLYSKAQGNKTIKTEPGEPSGNASLEQRSSIRCSYSAAQNGEKNYGCENKQLEKVVEGLAISDTPRETFAEPSNSNQTVLGSDPDFGVIYISAEACPPLVEEKKPQLAFETVENTEDPPQAFAPALTRSPLYVEMRTEEDECLVKKFIQRLGGIVHELRRNSS